MAEIAGGYASSHGPLLILPPEQWFLRREVDRTRRHRFRGGHFTFDELVAHRRGEQDFEAEIRPEVCAERYARCQAALDALGERIRADKPDILLVVGDDQKEWFERGVQPAFTVFSGEAVVNTAFDPDDHTDWHLSRRLVETVRHTPVDTPYACVPDLARHIIAHLTEKEFDVSACDTVPENGHGPIGIGHAYTFVYRRILSDEAIPLVPVLINTFYPPNQPTPKRCYDLGRAIGRAVSSWGRTERVAVLASGGLSHYVVDEAWDKRMLAAMAAWDEDALKTEPDNMFQSGTSETKNWLVALGALSVAKPNMTLIDYVPCYRSEAGTGSGMGFAVWH
jgi:hypothetical protein